MNIVKLGSTLTLGLFAQSVLALPMFYTDRASFDAATGGGLSFESFESFTPVSPAPASATFTGFTVSETNDAGNNSLGRATTAFVGAAVTDGTRAVTYFDRGPSLGNFTLFTPAITAFGLDVTTTIASNVAISGSVASTLALGANTPAFWGVIDTDGITSLTFAATGTTAGNFNVGFDAVSFGRAAPPPAADVPAPAVLALLGIGLAGLGWSRRRA